MYILGISCWFHDSAACLIKNGKIISAVQEERFTRKKQDASFPINAIKYCLNHSQIKASDLECVVFYEDSNLKFKRVKESWIRFFPKSIKNIIKGVPSWYLTKRHSKKNIFDSLSKANINVPLQRYHL